MNIVLSKTYLLHKEKYKHNKLKIIAPTQNDEFELPDGSYYVTYSRWYQIYH